MAEEVATNKTLEILAKIKAKQWKAMGKTVEQMREFTEEAGMGDFVSDLKETLSLQIQEVLAPLKNEINAAVVEALEPIMPLIVEFMAGITNLLVGGIKSWEAILTGNWDKFFAWMSKTATDDMKVLKNNIRQFFDDMFSGAMGRDLMKGWEGFWGDIGKGWSGFWSDLGWR